MALNTLGTYTDHMGMSFSPLIHNLYRFGL